MQIAPSLMAAKAIRAIGRAAQPDGSWIVYEPGDELPENVFRTPQSLGQSAGKKKIVFPEEFVLRSDGQDFYPAFVRAQDAGDVIELQANKTYQLSRAIRNKSNKRWIGGGPSTVLENTYSGSNPVLRSGFLLGNIHPAMFEYGGTAPLRLPCYDVDPVGVGSTAVKLVTENDAAQFAIGQFVAVRHVDEIFNPTASAFFPLMVHFAKVVGVVTDVVFLSRPLRYAIPSACISPIGATTDTFMGYEWEFVENVHISDMTIKARGPLSTRTGAFNSSMRRIVCDSADYHLSSNALVDCDIEGLTGNVANRLIEIKCYSQNTRVVGVVGAVTGAGGNAPVDIGEQSNFCEVENVCCSLPNTFTSNVEALKVNAPDNKASNIQIIHHGAGAGAPVVTLPGTNFEGYGPDNIELENIYANAAPARTHHISVGDALSSENPKNYVIRRFVTSGTPSSGRSLRVAASGAVGVTEACNLGFPHEIASGATAPVDLGSQVAGQSPRSHAGTASPEGSIASAAGAIYQRTGAIDAYPAYVKTGSTANQGWNRLRTIGSYSERNNVDVTIGTATPEHQAYVGAVTQDRYVTLPSVSAADRGWPFSVHKLDASGSGKVGVKSPAGIVLAEIPAASRGTIQCVWSGSAWQALAFIAS